jgi:Protein of unknown function (DUF1353)
MKVTLLNRPTLHTDFKKKWQYCLTNPVSYLIEGVEIPDCNVFSDHDQFLGYVRSNKLTIRKGYAFDGMTNYPDSAQNLSDALLHDWLYQTGIVSRLDADRLLRASMKSNQTPHRWLVFSGVRIFGWACYKKSDIRIELL